MKGTSSHTGSTSLSTVSDLPTMLSARVIQAFTMIDTKHLLSCSHSFCLVYKVAGACVSQFQSDVRLLLQLLCDHSSQTPQKIQSVPMSIISNKECSVFMIRLSPGKCCKNLPVQPLDLLVSVKKKRLLQNRHFYLL